MATALQQVQEAYWSRLQMPPDDRPLPDFLLSTMVANQMKSISDPLWCWLIGPPGSGKNEALRVFRDHPTTFFISSLTANALMSGHQDENNPEVDPSLLPQLDGKVLVFEDTAALLEMGDFTINKIMGDLRNLYGDEVAMKASGTAGTRTYKARFGIIFGGTPAIDTIMSRHQQLGERFVAMRVARRAAKRPLDARLRSLQHVRQSMAEKTQWRKELHTLVHTAYNDILARLARDGDTVQVDSRVETQLYQLSDLVARLRTVPVEGMAVDPETGNRLIQQFIGLGSAHALCDERHAWSFEDTQFIQRIANDTLPRWVVELLCFLAPPADEGQPLQRPSVAYDSVAHHITAVSTQVLALYVRQYRYLGIITPDSMTGYNGHVQLSEEAVQQLHQAGLLFGERGI